MFYIKAKLSENVEVKVPLYDDGIYTQCPECGTEHTIETDILAHIIDEGDDFASASVYCEKCSKKETAVDAAAIKEAIESGKMSLNEARIRNGLEPIPGFDELVKKA